MSEFVSAAPFSTAYHQYLDAEIGAYAQACFDIYHTHEQLRDDAVRQLRRAALIGVELEGPAETYMAYTYVLPDYVASLTAAARQRAPTPLQGHDAELWLDLAGTVHGHSLPLRSIPIAASSLPAYTAIRISLDDTVLTRARQQLAAFGGVGSDVLDDAALPISQQVIGLATDPLLAQRFYQRVNGSALGNLLRGLVSESLPSRVRDAGSVALALHRLSSPRPGSAYSQYIEGAAQLESQYTEARYVLTRLQGDLSPEYHYLLYASLAEVQSVIDGVRRLRAAAQQNGCHMTDSEVYLHMRQAVDCSSSNSRPARERTFSLIHALMNGNPYGRLPF